MQVQVRELGSGDVEIWRALRAEGVRLFPLGFIVSPDELDSLSPEVDKRILAGGGQFAAFDGGTGVGILGMRRHLFKQMRHRAEIGPVYVTPAWQGKGISGRLLEAARAYALSVGITQLELQVGIGNSRAIAFYERNGFVCMGRIPNAVRSERGDEDDCFYVLRLDQAE